MVRWETQYYRFNRILLLAVGLWPYQQSTFTQFQFIFLCIILSTGIIFQLTPLIILKCTSDLIAKVMSSVSFFTLCIIKYNAFRLNIEVVKNLLMELQHKLNELNDENEIAIVEKYSCIAKRYTFTLTVLGVCAICIAILAQFWSNIAVVSMNVSQSHHLFITTEYFVDQEKYFYLIMLHIYVVISIGLTIMIAIGTMLITYVQYTCGMFKIASYRIEHAMNVNILQNITLKNKILMAEGIIYAVDIHRQAMKLSKHWVSAMEMMLFCLIACGVVCLTVNLFQIASSENNFEELFIPFTFVFASSTYMFIANYMGQNVMDHNNHVFFTAYEVQWYMAPLHIQRLILFLLQRSAKEFTLSVGGLFIGSLECFATMVKASVSYFTFMYSAR